MKQRKIITIAIVMMLMTSSIFSQSIFIKGQAGYGLPTQKQIIDVNYTSISNENIYGSFGGGINIQAAAGIITKSNIGFEFMLGYQTGQKITGVLFKEFKGSLISVSPSIIFITKNEKKLNRYLKAGFLTGLPLMKLTVGGTDVKHFRGGIPFGYDGSLGLKYKMGDNLSLFAELSHNSLVWFPRKRKESNGTVVRFYDIIDVTSPAGSEILHHTFPYSSTGVNLGLVIGLNTGKPIEKK